MHDAEMETTEDCDEDDEDDEDGDEPFIIWEFKDPVPNGVDFELPAIAENYRRLRVKSYPIGQKKFKDEEKRYGLRYSTAIAEAQTRYGGKTKPYDIWV